MYRTALHCTAQVLHYGMCCFEGMKAYAGVDGRMRLFRPDMNMERLRRSARRLQLADFDPQVGGDGWGLC
jgi:branched-chain amino acid aminotransferase